MDQATATSRHLDKNGIAEPIGEGKERDAVYVHFRKAFDIVCQRLLLAWLVLCGLNKWMRLWVGSMLDNQVQVSSVVQSSPVRQFLAVSLSDQHLGQHC